MLDHLAVHVGGARRTSQWVSGEHQDRCGRNRVSTHNGMGPASAQGETIQPAPLRT